VATIRITQTFSATPDVLWEELRQIQRHVLWMHDAVAIAFETDQHEGVDTQFLCTTKVGPFVTQDKMVITRWVEEKVMGVEHRGLIRGSGTFKLSARSGGSELTWREALDFPWWLGGPLGAHAATPILRSIWRSNLRTLAALMAKV
jgi:hypothetical protein